MEGGATQVRDEGGKWFIEAGRLFSLDSKQSAIGAGSASFRGPSSSLKLNPGKDSLLERSSRFRDFSIEFWLYPANAENGETILSWQSLRSVPKGSSSSAGGGSFPQSFGCTISGGRIRWDFQGFFQRASTNAGTDLMLRATNPLLPRSWSHHLLRFDGDTGLLEYVVNGVTEAVSFATASGHEGGEVFAPAVGAASPLILGADYVGLLDEFRISRSCIEKPNLKPFARDGGLVLSPVADLGFGNSRLLSVEMQAKTPGATGIELSYRISDEWIGWRYDSPAWIPFRAGDRLPAAARGRYVQIRAELYPDGTGRLTPSLSSLTLHYEPDPLPPPPARVEAIAKDGGIELRWSRVPESDVAGYLVYYGGSPGDYFGTGAAEGQSPIDVGNATSFTLTGLPNGGLVYLAVAVYDTGTHSAEKAWRAGEFSAEVSARPSRTAR